MDQKRQEKKTQIDQDNRSVIDGYDYLGNSCSAMDCTGLIPSAPQNKAERESYEDIYHYEPKAAPKEETGQKEKKK